MNDFDALVGQMDELHQETFAIDVTIDGYPTNGIFDENTDEFEGVSTIHRTLTLPVSNLPFAVEHDETKVILTSNGREFTVRDSGRVDEQLILVLA